MSKWANVNTRVPWADPIKPPSNPRPIDGPFIVLAILVVALLAFIAFIFLHPSHGPLETHCDQHDSLIYSQDGLVLKILNDHRDCRKIGA